MTKRMDMWQETNYYMRYSEGLAVPTSECDVTRRQRPMKDLVSFTLQKKLRSNMRRTQLLGYSPQPACSG